MTSFLFLKVSGFLDFFLFIFKHRFFKNSQFETLDTMFYRNNYKDLKLFNKKIGFFSLLGSMYPLPRVIYAMASDGLIFKWMGKVSSRFHTPFMGTLSAGLLTGMKFILKFSLLLTKCKKPILFHRIISSGFRTQATR